MAAASEVLIMCVAALPCRVGGSFCVHRKFWHANTSNEMPGWGYAVEPAFHESLIQSEHRYVTRTHIHTHTHTHI